MLLLFLFFSPAYNYVNSFTLGLGVVLLHVQSQQGTDHITLHAIENGFVISITGTRNFNLGRMDRETLPKLQGCANST